MTRVLITPRAVEDLAAIKVALGLPDTADDRVRQSLRVLTRFPLAGRALPGAWARHRFLLGPWPWMVLVYLRDEEDDVVYVVAVHDARSSSAATG